MVTLYLIIFLLANAKAARILGIFPTGAKSHFEFNKSIMKSLHAAGHEITIISPFKETEPLENITFISMSLESLESTTIKGSIENFVKLPLFTYFRSIAVINQRYCENFSRLKYRQDVLSTPLSKFDVLIMEYTSLYHCFTKIVEKFNIPIILTIPIRAVFFTDTVFGNPNHPAVVPTDYFFIPQHMNFIQKIENTAVHLYTKFLWRIIFGKFDDTKQRIQDDSKSVSTKAFSLLFQNSHSSLLARPMLQNVIEVGGIHLKPSKTLPQEIQKFIDEATAGVILFSFGSITHGSFLSSNIVSMFKEVFSQIPQRVIWKYEKTLEELPQNVMISDWIPQRDILAHKKVVAFISHCGIGGIYEAVYETVPLVMIPFYGDQLPNAATLEEKGVGVVLNALKLSKKKIKNALDLVVNDTRYRENMRQLSRRFKDRPMTPQESVVYWTEYVISHQGALHLRSYSADVPLHQYYLLDVLLVVALALLLLFTSVRLLIRVSFPKIVKMRESKKKKN